MSLRMQLCVAATVLLLIQKTMMILFCFTDSCWSCPGCTPAGEPVSCCRCCVASDASHGEGARETHQLHQQGHATCQGRQHEANAGGFSVDTVAGLSLRALVESVGLASCKKAAVHATCQGRPHETHAGGFVLTLLLGFSCLDL